MSQPAGRILVVEDNRDTAVLIEHALTKHCVPAHVVAMESGEAALEHLLGTEDTPPARLPDLILLDLKLPRLSGIDVLEALRADERTRRVPVVIFTSSKEDSDIQACYAAGANSYVRKPVDFEAFTSALELATRYWLTLNERPPG
ncbi:MAG: response regulator [Candidatus Thermoplasmatota archaeon]|nr:response regulator [Candidatus Thermoplasmatota archaeon]